MTVKVSLSVSRTRTVRNTKKIAASFLVCAARRFSPRRAATFLPCAAAQKGSTYQIIYLSSAYYEN